MKLEEVGEDLFTGYFIIMLFTIFGVALFFIWAMRPWLLIGIGAAFSMYTFGRFYRLVYSKQHQHRYSYGGEKK